MCHYQSIDAGGQTAAVAQKLLQGSQFVASLVCSLGKAAAGDHGFVHHKDMPVLL